jgi:hypothetical protein
VGENGVRNFVEMTPFSTSFRNLLHAANLRHGANGFTSPPKEGMMRIFSPESSDGFGRVGEASMLTARQPKPLKEIYYVK